MKQISKKIVSSIILAAITAVSSPLITTNAATTNQVALNNPYANVDWASNGQYLSNLHTHTNNSDGDQTQANMFKQYQALKYDFLSFTDHDVVMSPWPNYGINDGKVEPSKGGVGGTTGLPAINGWKTSDVLCIKGNEVSKTGWENHHFNSYFSDFVSDGTAPDVASLLRQCAAFDPNGLQVLNHPGRYTYMAEGQRYWDPTDPQYPNVNNRFFKGSATSLTWEDKVNWYVNQYKDIPSLVGLEVLNYGNQYPKDRQLWDDILTKTMPERPIWGFANDDSHYINMANGYNMSVNRDMDIMVLPNKTVSDFKEAMKNGNFYFSSRYTLPGHGFTENPNNNLSPGAGRDKLLPKITNIKVNEAEGTINIEGENVNSIQWISCGEVVGTGATINYKTAKYATDTVDTEGNKTVYKAGDNIDRYVRAVLTGDGGESFTQPFGIVRGEVQKKSDFTINSTFNVASLQPDKMLEAKTTVTNNKSSLKSVVVVTALYDENDKMVNVAYISKNIPVGKTETLSSGFNLPADVANHKVKVFVWDGASITDSNMQPLSNVVTLN
jgi:hypothetical protein